MSNTGKKTVRVYNMGTEGLYDTNQEPFVASTKLLVSEMSSKLTLFRIRISVRTMENLKVSSKANRAGLIDWLMDSDFHVVIGQA